jgi:hypothetical protein
MTIVTDVILSIDRADDKDGDSVGIMPLVNAFFDDNPWNKGGLVDIDAPGQWYGGSYPFQRVYVGSISSLSLDDFLEHLCTLPWKEPEVVQLILREEEDLVFRIINLKDVLAHVASCGEIWLKKW